MRVLQVVENLDRGAVENWLVRCFLHSRKTHPEWEWTFYCVLGRPGVLDERVRAAGGRIILAPAGWEAPVQLVRRLRAELRRGRYAVMHAHHDLMSAPYLCAALGLPGLTRWVHVHNADLGLPTPRRAKQAVCRPLFRWICRVAGTGVVGISEHVLGHFLGGAPRAGRDHVLYYAVDAARFRFDDAARQALRHEFGLTGDRPLWLFLGRMERHKNPLFVLDMLAAAAAAGERPVCLFAGAGELVEPVRQRAAALGLTPQVRILGWRDDVERWLSAADVFVFPRIEEDDTFGKEGLGLTMVEAQSAGLPVLTSFGVSAEACVIPGRFRQLPLGAGAAAWLAAARELDAAARSGRADAWRAVDASRFGLDTGVAALMALYRQGNS